MTDEEASRSVSPPEGPHAFIQWKGTDVCMDVYCKCGQPNHIDGFFAYNVKCRHCGAMYTCIPYVTLVEITVEPSSMLQDNL